MNCTLNWEGEEKRLTLNGSYQPVTSFTDRKRQDALADPFKVNGDRLRLLFFFAAIFLFSCFRIYILLFCCIIRFLLLIFLVFLLLFFCIGRFRYGDKRRAQVFLQKDHVWFHASWETEIKLKVVIDWIKHTCTKEVEKLAFGIKGRAKVFQDWFRHLMCLAALDLTEFNRHLL